MSQAATQLDGHAVFQQVATVVAVERGQYELRAGGRRLQAARATSCLVAPHVGDRVLLALSETGECFVLAVLDGDPQRPTCIAPGNEVELCADKLAIRGARGVELTSGEEVSINGKRISWRALDAHVFFDKLSYLGSYLQSEVERTSLAGRSLDCVLDRIRQRLGRSYRTVDDFERVRAGTVDVAASGMVSLRGENTLITADELVKLDGEQVHVG